MKVLMFALMLVAATTVLASPVVLNDPAPLDGSWTFSMTTDQGVVTGDATLTVSDLGAVSGTLSSPSGDLTIFGFCDSSLVRIYASSDTAMATTFTGSRTPDTISGTAQVPGVDPVQWVATRK